MMIPSVTRSLSLQVMKYVLEWEGPEVRTTLYSGRVLCLVKRHSERTPDGFRVGSVGGLGMPSFSVPNFSSLLKIKVYKRGP